ncbi:MAG: phenylalanine--tRNA ligase beta subunit-related protein [Acidobacteriota bacterium]|nr:MAG: phenylalanine--tRNA ligase beta subunit-related protein [Acidobacteriota bacterium]
MKNIAKIVVTDDVFELFPDFYRGLVLVKDVTIRKSYKPVRRLLREQVDSPAALADPRLLAWEEAHRKFGSDPERFPPSIQALLSRVTAEPNLPFINSVVALFNTISLKHVVPCGGDDVDRVDGDLVLGRADGNESFVALGSQESESPEPGEVIYFDDGSNNVLCRRWNWRNGDRTKIEETSKRLVINVDGLPPTTPEMVRDARDELAELLREHGQADVETTDLNAGRRTLETNW